MKKILFYYLGYHYFENGRRSWRFYLDLSLSKLWWQGQRHLPPLTDIRLLSQKCTGQGNQAQALSQFPRPPSLLPRHRRYGRSRVDAGYHG